jgi:hypothetical protein
VRLWLLLFLGLLFVDVPQRFVVDTFSVGVGFHGRIGLNVCAWVRILCLNKCVNTTPRERLQELPWEAPVVQ